MYRKSGELKNRMEIYVFFSVAMTVFTVVLYIYEISSYYTSEQHVRFIDILMFLHKILAGLDVVFIVLAIVFKCIVAKVLIRDDEQNKYDQETQWFWLRFQIMAILLGTFPVEILSLQSESVFEIFLIADTLKLFCSIIIFAILIVGKNDVVLLLIEKYSEIRSNCGGNYVVSHI